MQIVDIGVLSRGEAGTPRAALTFPTLLSMSDGSVIATCRAGSTKDSTDELVEFYRSDDEGHTWKAQTCPFGAINLNGVRGSVKVCYLTEVEPGRLMAGLLWIDRQTFTDKPLFNEESEGCLPMAILLADSNDGGKSWSPPREVPMPVDIGPPSLTSPVLKLRDGILALSIETNKQYLDSTKWYQRVVFFHSHDDGKTWGSPVTVGEDPSGRIFYWDLRVAVAPDGRVGAFSWTYDSHTNEYLNIHRLIGSDNGRAWSLPEDVGFTDQAAHPAILADGRVVVAWVDRFGSHSIRARQASAVDAPFDPDSEVVIYTHELAAAATDNTGELLADMKLWSFGLPYVEALPNGDVLVVYYAGNESCMDIHWSRLRLDV